MTLRVAAAFASAWLIGWLTIALLWRSPSRKPVERVIRVCLAFGIGHGITSCIAFVYLLVAGRLDGLYYVVEVGVIALLAAVRYRVGKREGPPLEQAENPPYTRARAWLAGAFYAATALALGTVALRLARWPHGGWDAWTIWNLRARSIFRSGEAWREQFSSFVLHADYPLLLPLTVLRGWIYAGSETTLVPSALAWLMMAATIGLLVSAVGALCGRAYGYIAGLVLLGYAYFVLHASTQLAELPLMFFFLAALALTAAHNARSPVRGDGTLVLAGLAAGLAAWTKNEGLLFVAAFMACHFFVSVRARGFKAYGVDVLRLAAGLLPVLAVVIYFKTHFAPPNAWLADMTAPRALTLISEPNRYALVLKEFARRFFYHSGFGVNTPYVLAAFIVCVGVTRRHMASFAHCALTLVVMIAGLMWVYLTAKLNVSAFISGSLDRVLVELWPAFLFCFFLIAAPVPANRGGEKRVAGAG